MLDMKLWLILIWLIFRFCSEEMLEWFVLKLFSLMKKLSLERWVIFFFIGIVVVLLIMMVLRILMLKLDGFRLRVRIF